MFFQLIKFSIVGISNTLVDFSAYVFLTRFFSFWAEHFIAANVAAMVAAASWSFFWNKRWTFCSNGGNTHREYARFLFVNIFGLGVNSGILYALVRFFDFFDLAAKAIGILVVFFGSFLIHKYWTFGDGWIQEEKHVDF